MKNTDIVRPDKAKGATTEMKNTDIVRLEAGKFRWEDIEGRGKCLVPFRGQVTANDVERCRAFYNTRGERKQIANVYVPGHSIYPKHFFTLMMSSRQGHAFCSYKDPQYLASRINEASEHSEICFGSWIDEGVERD